MLWLYLAGWAILLGAELDATLASYAAQPAEPEPLAEAQLQEPT
jgi:uncharacterized BrkB/YihY/UPF0761 family membrane protein